ncbi:MAG TPA: N-acetylmuramoyl-L-alanine amidase, partial [Chitinophagaceae bacterium]|nr:N-acetylmuramoyl-L-alanine amidase [Chitinophagaceae bacterium]
IFRHELVHVREKHSLDKLFLQLVLVFFWYNPFFWIIRNELRDIHEFMADKKAVAQEGTAALARMILQAAYPQRFNAFINPFFQTSVKRRIAMLSKLQHPRVTYFSRILALPLIALIIFAFTAKTPGGAGKIIPLEKEFVLVIDAGHGGNDPGIQAEGLSEKDLALTLAKMIREGNTNPNLRIELTRNSDEGIPLKSRTEAAAKLRADFFLSLHINGRPGNTTDSGIEVYVPSSNTRDQRSVLFGSLLAKRLNEVYPTQQQLQKRQMNIWVLNNNPIPAALIECGYLTNPKDRTFLQNETNLAALAQKILKAAEQFAVLQEQKNSSVPIIRDTVPSKLAETDTLPNIQEALLILNGEEKGKFGDYPKKQEYLSNGGVVEILEAAEGRRRYGAKGANGVVILQTKNTPGNGTFRGTPTDSIPGKALLVIDGKIAGFVGDLPTKMPEPQFIESVHVLKDNAAAKYGEKGKYGVIEIMTKKEPSAPTPRPESSPEDASNALVILDGREVGLYKDNVELKKIPGDQIQSVNVLKGEEAKKIYGVKGKGGVILITTKTGRMPEAVPDNRTTQQPQLIFETVEKPAQFPGGSKALRSYLAKQLGNKIAVSPETEEAQTAVVQVVVTNDGSLQDFKRITRLGHGVEDKMIEALRKGPKWVPARQNGHPVDAYRLVTLHYAPVQD